MDTSDLYSTRIQKNFDEDQSEIISILKANSKTTLKVINYYKGLPMSYPATIVEIDSRGAVDMDIQPEQALAIEECRSAFIRSPLFKYDLLAQTQYVNVRKKAVTFIKFSYVEIMAERRNFVRMQLEPPAKAVITSPGGIIDCELSDISLSGMNILVPNYCELQPAAEYPVTSRIINPELNVDIELDITGNLIAISADKPPYSYRFSFTPDKPLERILSKFIFQRQIEIIKDIKDSII